MSLEDRLVLRGDADPRLRATTASVAILAGRPDLAAVRDAALRASRLVPRLRHRAVLPSLPTTEPRWVTDPDFDLDQHLRRIALPSRARLDDFWFLVEGIVAAPMDPARPQWSLTLIEGLPGRRYALVAALSPVITEGGVPVDMLGRLAGCSAADSPPVAEPVPVDLDPGDLMREGLRELPTRTAGLAWGGAREVAELASAASAHPRTALEGLLRTSRVLGGRLAPETGPSTPGLAGRGARRQIVTLTRSPDQVADAARHPLGAVHQRALATALATYQQARGLTSPAAVVAASHPMGVRASLDPTARALARRLTAVGAFLPPAALDLVRGPVRTADAVAVSLGERGAVGRIAGVGIVEEYAVGPVPGNAVTSVALLRDGALFVAVRSDSAAIADPQAWQAALEDGWDQAGLSRASQEGRA